MKRGLVDAVMEHGEEIEATRSLALENEDAITDLQDDYALLSSHIYRRLRRLENEVFFDRLMLCITVWVIYFVLQRRLP